MTLKVGRVSLTTPTSVPYTKRNTVDDGRSPSGMPSPARVGSGVHAYRLDGRETGSSGQTTMDSLVTEGDRFGSVYVTEDSSPAVIAAGYYAIEGVSYSKDPGAPKRRKWSLNLTQTPMPLVCRQAENDNVTGADTADSTADEALKTVYTPTTSEVLVLDPRNVAGAEALNLPAGSWRIIARVYQVTNNDAKFRFKTTKLDGTVLVTGSQVAIGAAGAWTDLDLGTFAVAQADDKANWYTLGVQGVAAHLGDTWIDRLYLLPA